MAKNKVTQAFRREARKVVKEQYNFLPDLIKPRPRYVPRFIWRNCMKIFVNVEALEKWANVGARIPR